MTLDYPGMLTMDEVEQAPNITSLSCPQCTKNGVIFPTSGVEDYKAFYMTARFVTGLVFYPIVCVFGLTGNVMSIIVMSQRQMTSSTNTYLFALAVSDLIKLICDFLYFMVILMFQINPSTGNRAYGFLYPYAHYVFNASLCISAWLVVSVAVERYIYVCHPTKVKYYCNISRARKVTSFVYILMSLLAVPYAMRYQTVQKYSNITGDLEFDVAVTLLWQNELFTEIYTWFQNLMRSIIPLVILIIMNACILNGIRRCRLLRSKTPKKHRITTMLIIVILVFLVCITPDTIMSTFFGLGYSEEDYLARGIREITDLLLLINSGTNFIIYCIFNTIFWNQFRRIFCCQFCRRSRSMTDRQLSAIESTAGLPLVKRRRRNQNLCVTNGFTEV